MSLKPALHKSPSRETLKKFESPKVFITVDIKFRYEGYGRFQCFALYGFVNSHIVAFSSNIF